MDGHTDRHTDKHTDNVKTVYPLKQSLRGCGGVGGYKNMCV